MERFMWDLLGWEEPHILHHGLLGIEGIKISTSTSKAKIDSGKYRGWEDPRTWSLRSLKKRGFAPEAIREFVLEFGMSNNDVTVPVDTLYTHNRDVIDAGADRYFFVEDPVELEVTGLPDGITAETSRHPEEDRGTRIIDVDVDGGTATVYIDRDDLQDGFLRLKDFCNVTVDGETAEFHSESHEPAVERGADIVQWVPDDAAECTVVLPDGTETEGLVEPDVPEDVVQFVRFGFVNVVDTEEPVEAWYTHH